LKDSGENAVGRDELKEDMLKDIVNWDIGGRMKVRKVRTRLENKLFRDTSTRYWGCIQSRHVSQT
jgi:hypothetical protein